MLRMLHRGSNDAGTDWRQALTGNTLVRLNFAHKALFGMVSMFNRQRKLLSRKLLPVE